MKWEGLWWTGWVHSQGSQRALTYCVFQCWYITSRRSASRGFISKLCSFSLRLWAVTESGSWWRAPWQPGTEWACRTLSCWRTTPARWRSSRTSANGSRRTSFMYELLFLFYSHIKLRVLMWRWCVLFPTDVHWLSAGVHEPLQRFGDLH